jgi:uncharacterized protein
MLEWLRHPWPWYIAGPLIGLTVPALLLAGNKSFGISSTLRQICAACIPANIPFFQYDWRKESWNLFFVAGIVIAGVLVTMFFPNPDPVIVNPTLQIELNGYGITNYNGLIPPEIFNWNALLSVRGLIMIIGGGFLVGFGTRYAGGCTSGHSIMGLATLQWPSLVATICFMAGGFFVANFILPLIMNL